MRTPRLQVVLTAITALFALMALLTPPAHAGKVYPAWVIPDSLNVRSGPGTDRDLIGSLTKGTKVHVTAFSNNWCWAKLPDGRWGWIAEWLLQFSAEKGRALAESAGVSSGASSSSSSSSLAPAWIIPDTTNVRSGPGTHYDKRGQLSRGTKVYIVKQERGWSKCRTPGGYGWVRDDLLERNVDAGRKLSESQSSPNVQASTSVSNRKAFVNGDGVRLRSGPGTNYSIKASLTRGQTVFVTETRGEWISVSVHGGTSGWIHKDLLKYDAGTSSSTPATSSPSSGSSSSGSGSTMKGFVNGSAVHLRSGPSLSDSIRAKVVKGQTLYITERNGDWYKASVHGGGEGWIHTSLVKLAGAGDTEQTATTKAFVAGQRVHLRSGPSTSDRIKALVVEGQTLYVTERQGDWYKVTVHGGESGWIHSSLVKLPGDASSGTSQPTPSTPGTPAPTPTPSRTVESLAAWIAEDLVNVRYGPGTDHGVKMKVGQGTKVTVLELSGHWCKIKDPDGNIGWVAGWVMNFKGPGQDPTATEGGQEVGVRTAWVARPEVNLRAGPGTSHAEIGEAALGTEVIILDREGDWYKVVLDNGKTGYMASWLLDTRAQRRVRQGEAAESSAPSAPSAPSNFGQAVVATAKQYIGSPYVRGGASPSGFDCSGFVHFVLKKNGVSVSRSSRSQFTQGTPVARDDLQVGDVVFFRNTYRAGISHVGIYVGGNQFIHAANSRTNVRIGDMNSSYYASRYAGARRMR